MRLSPKTTASCTSPGFGAGLVDGLVGVTFDPLLVANVTAPSKSLGLFISSMFNCYINNAVRLFKHCSFVNHTTQLLVRAIIPKFQYITFRNHIMKNVV